MTKVDRMDRYQTVLVRTLAAAGARDVRVERRRDCGAGRATFAVSADWPTGSFGSFMYPGHVRIYVVESTAAGGMVWGEVDLVVPVDLANFDAIASTLG